MKLRLVVLAVTSCVALSSASALAGSSALPPLLSLSAATARPGDRIVVQWTRVPSPVRKPMRLYLLSAQFAADVRLRSDLRLYFIGSLAAKRGRSLSFTVPSFASGTYFLAYCRCTGASGSAVTVLRSQALRIGTPPEAASCAVTKPNGTTPRGVQPSSSFHGDGALWVLLPRDGVLRSQEPDGRLFNKMLWLGAGVRGTLRVSYRRLDVAAPGIAAVTVAGSFGGYTPSWASRMYFDRGCWDVRGTVGNASLEIVVRVVGS